MYAVDGLILIGGVLLLIAILPELEDLGAFAGL